MNTVIVGLLPQKVEPNAVLDNVPPYCGVPVYDLTVEDIPEFFANGVLVHNSPIPLGGGMFKQQYFNLQVLSAPLECKRIRFWDRASTADGGCYTAGVLLARDKEDTYYVEHVVHGQWEPTERNTIMRATALRDRIKYGPRFEPRIAVEAEGGSSGRDAWLGIVKCLQGFHVEEITVTGQKDTRAEPWSTQLAAGNVKLVSDGTWDINSYIEEHVNFRPVKGARLGKYKDQVDSSSGAFNLLSTPKMSIGLRTFTMGASKKNILKSVVCSRDELANLLIDDHRCLMVLLRSPDPVGTDESPIHGLTKLVDTLTLTFADINTADYQDKWQEPVPPFDKTPDQLVMTAEQGKKLWAFLLRKRDPAPDVYIFVDDGDRRSLSVAYAVCDVLRLARNSSLYLPSDNDNTYSHTDKAAPNQHVYQMVKTTRGMVM